MSPDRKLSRVHPRVRNALRAIAGKPKRPCSRTSYLVIGRTGAVVRVIGYSMTPEMVWCDRMSHSPHVYVGGPEVSPHHGDSLGQGMWVRRGLWLGATGRDGQFVRAQVGLPKKRKKEERR